MYALRYIYIMRNAYAITDMNINSGDISSDFLDVEILASNT